MRYRSEIDGLRAWAVLPVIFFHAGISGFSGGYVGVDVFFVISGYLITSILLSDLEQNRFSIIGFYERRARRILPALFFMLALSSVLAIWLMQPADMIDFSEALISVPLFVSNFLFYGKDGYFDAAMESSPVFHTWSLAVEEQYYLLVPLLLMALWKFGKNHLFIAFFLLSLLSLVLAELVVVIDPMLAFFHLPFRFWELGMGSLIAVAERNGFLNVRNGLADVLAALGLIMVGYSVIAFDSLTPTPSVMTLIPVLGAALIISFSGSAQNSYKTVVAKVLSFKVFVGIGLISYSAYLLHQPLLAFVRIYRYDHMNNGVVAKVMLVTLVMAFFSWFFVERPFRNKSRLNSKQLLKVSILGSVFFILIGFFGVKTNGFQSFYEWRIPESEKFFLQNAKELLRNRNLESDDNANKECFTIDLELECVKKYGKPILIFGDSHAGDLFGSLSKGDMFRNVVRNGRFPCYFFEADKVKDGLCDFGDLLTQLSESNKKYRGAIFNQTGAKFLKTEMGGYLDQTDVDYILEGGNLKVDLERLYATLDFLDILAERNEIVWLGPWVEPRYPLDNPRKMSRYNLSELGFHQTLIKSFKEIDREAQAYILSNNLNVKYVSLLHHDQDDNWIRVIEEDCVTFNDSNHLSGCGQEIATSFFELKLTELAEGKIRD